MECVSKLNNFERQHPCIDNDLQFNKLWGYGGLPILNFPIWTCALASFGCMINKPQHKTFVYVIECAKDTKIYLLRIWLTKYTYGMTILSTTLHMCHKPFGITNCYIYLLYVTYFTNKY